MPAIKKPSFAVGFARINIFYLVTELTAYLPFRVLAGLFKPFIMQHYIICKSP